MFPCLGGKAEAVSKRGTGTWGQGTWGREDAGTWRGIFTICLTFHHISQNPRLLIVTALYPGVRFSFVQCETDCEQSSFLSQRPGGK